MWRSSKEKKRQRNVSPELTLGALDQPGQKAWNAGAQTSQFLPSLLIPGLLSNWFFLFFVLSYFFPVLGKMLIQVKGQRNGFASLLRK